MAQAEIDLSPEIQELGIEQYARELDSNGLTIVPPEVNQFGLERIDRIVEIILERAEAMTGSRWEPYPPPISNTLRPSAGAMVSTGAV